MPIAELLTTFTIGIAASGNPCVLPLYPGFLAYLGNRSRRLNSRKGESLLGLSVVLGVITSMLIIGAIIALTKVSAARFLRYASPAADASLIALGVVIISGWQPWARLRPLGIPAVSNPLFGAFLYGVLYGPITVPCNLPLLISATALSFSAAELLQGVLVFFVFGMGAGVPLLALSIATKAQRGWVIEQLKSRYKLVNIFAGVVLIGIAIYDLILTSQFLRIFS